MCDNDVPTHKHGTRHGINRYRCGVGHCFAVNHRRKPPVLWIEHIDGVPLRKLANEHAMSTGAVYRQIKCECDQLPDNNQLTKTYCNRFCGILIVDGKYVKVRGFPKKIPWMYGMDYLTHDIVVSMLAPSENTIALTQFFALLKRCHYPLQIVVSDDREAIAQGLARIYPNIPLQLCHNHYVENIRQLLRIRTDPTHSLFFNELKMRIFDVRHDGESVRSILYQLFMRFAQHDVVYQDILQMIDMRRNELFASAAIPHCPDNSNLIELYNSHLNGRLKTIKGFKSFASATQWLNAYTIRRRTKSLTDCGPTFKHLNGYCSFEQTIKKQAAWPDLLHIPDPRKSHPK